MAKKAQAAEQDAGNQDELMAQIEALKSENAELKAKQIKVEEPAAKEIAKGITLQHIKPVRMWTVPKTQILKVHRGTGMINNPRFLKNVVLTPGCIVSVTPELAKMLLQSKDFQKYGVEK